VLLGTIMALCILFTNEMRGQITITLADANVVGDTIINVYDTIVPVGTTVGGTGSQTWDFSALQFDYADTFIYVDPSTTANAADFSTATLATDDGGFSAYLEANSNGLFFNGIAADFFGTGSSTSLIYAPTQKIIEFPSTSGTTYIDTSAYRLKFAGADVGAPLDSIAVYHRSFLTANVDAYGTVTTPSGTYQVIRQYTMELTYDSLMLKDPAFTGGIWVFGDPALIGFPNPTIDTIYNYQWFAAGMGYPVIEMETDGPAGNVIGANFRMSSQVLAAIVDITNTSCNGDCDGSVDVTGISGTPPYTYLWDDPTAQSTSAATALCAGTYTVTVTDATGGTSTAIATITEPAVLAVSLFGVNPSCDSCADGWASAAVTGGTAPFMYLWDDSTAQTSSSATNLMNGTYTVNVTDANGCTVISDSIVILEIESIDGVTSMRIYPNPTSGLIYIDQAGAGLKASILDIRGRSVFEGDLNKSGTIDLSGLPAGTYYVQIRDEKGLRTKKVVLIR